MRRVQSRVQWCVELFKELFSCSRIRSLMEAWHQSAEDLTTLTNWRQTLIPALGDLVRTFWLCCLIQTRFTHVKAPQAKDHVGQLRWGDEDRTSTRHEHVKPETQSLRKRPSMIRRQAAFLFFGFIPGKVWWRRQVQTWGKDWTQAEPQSQVSLSALSPTL